MRAIAWVLLLLLASNFVGAQAGPSLPSKSSASFAGKDVRRGVNVWFFSTVKASGLGEGQTKIFFRNSRVRFRANGTEYVVAGPNGSITFSPAAESAGTSLDPALQEFRTVVPLRFAGRVFLAGILYIVPDDVGLKQRTGEATWEGEFYSDTANMQLTWQWEARAYWGGFAEYRDLTIEATDASGECAARKNNWWYGQLCMPLRESLDTYFLLAKSSASPVVPNWDIPRKAPVAIARLAKRAVVGAPTELDGKSSFALTGRPLSYSWTITCTPDGKLPALTNADTPSPSFVPTREGMYTLQLVVSDAGVRSPPWTMRLWSYPALREKWTFTLPGAVLLFDGDEGLHLVAQGRPVTSVWGGRARPSLSRDGRLMATGYAVPDDSALKYWLQPSSEADHSLYLQRPIQNALALYMVPESKTVTFPVGATMERVADLGPRSEIIDTAISPDNSKIAFTYGGTIQLLDIASGKIQVLYPSATRGGIRPSWSPDGTHIVFERNHKLVTLEISSGNERVLGAGCMPAWSPAGEWIAHFDESNKKLLLTRPDGSGQKELKDLAGNWRSILRPWVSFEESPVWSPDGKQLLLNINLGETLRLAPVTEVALLDVATGKMKRLRKNGLSITGWAEQNSR